MWYRNITSKNVQEKRIVVDRYDFLWPMLTLPTLISLKLIIKKEKRQILSNNCQQWQYNGQQLQTSGVFTSFHLQQIRWMLETRSTTEEQRDERFWKV